MTNLLDLVGQDVQLRRAASTNGGEWCGPCPRCRGRDRFRVWPARGRYWCRQCACTGDAIQYLRDFHGLTFTDARQTLGLDPSSPSRQQWRLATVPHIALAAAKHRYREWERRRLVELADQYQVLLAEQKVAEIAYRAMHRKPEAYTAEEQSFWTRRLGSLYDRVALLEQHLDILTFRAYEPARFAWWQEETVSPPPRQGEPYA